MKLRKPTPSMAVALTALTVAMGGTSYAAVKITGANVKNGSLTTSDIKDQTLKSRDIGKGGVKSSEVSDQSLQSKDLGKGSVGASEVKNGSLSATDFKPGTVPAGPTGPAGPAGTGRWVLVNAAGAIEAQSGGFTVSDGYTTNDNVYIDANEPLDDNGVVATIAATNGANPNFNGEISASRCAITNIVACAPTGTNDAEHFVVAPRNSAGDAPLAANRKRFYVVISGDSSDVHAPN